MASRSMTWPTLDTAAGARSFAVVRAVVSVLEIGLGVLAATALQADAVGLAVLVGLGLVSHAVLVVARPGPALPHLAGALVVLDIARFTGILALAGGASTPLSAAYLVYVVLAALLLQPGWVAVAVVAAVGGYGLLFLAPPPRHHHHDMFLHVVGMWAAVAGVAPLVAVSIGVLRRALHRAARAVADERGRRERDARLAAVGTLAAGAAHELATPLSTIAVATGELARRAEGDPALAADVELIRAEVARCREILGQLAADVGAGMGELHQAEPVGDLLDRALALLPDDGRAEALERIVLEGDDALLDHAVRVPGRLLSHALSGLVRNALQATPPPGAVTLAARRAAADLVLEVRDAGRGMPPEVLERAVEPFFTTRAPGVGTGLGLFVADALARQLGGHLALHSVEGEGTTAALHLPWERLSP